MIAGEMNDRQKTKVNCPSLVIKFLTSFMGFVINVVQKGVY